MAERSHHKQTERAATPSVPPVESFANGDLNISLNRLQWMNIAGALAIAAGECAQARDYEQVFAYNGLCSNIGQRLGLVNVQTAGSGDIPPPGLARGAAAS